jgi:hypothetical protein
MKSWIIAFVTTVVLVTAVPAFGWMNFNLTQPFDTLADNSIVDIIYDGTYVWLATGNGVSGTRDGGATWRSFNKTNGFKRSSVSALASEGARLWVATSYDTSSSGSTQQVPSGGGVEITDNFGADWTLVEPKSASSPGMLAYDLAVFDSAVWAPCFYGGLIRSLDRGRTWENVFVDTVLRNDFNNRTYNQLGGRYFSTIIDPYHSDTVIVWAGTAQGIQHLYYIGKHKKLIGNRINDIAFDSTAWWYATDRGLTKFNDSLFSFNSYDTDNGMPGNFISAVGAEGKLVCAAVYDTLTQRSLGFAISTDSGSAWRQETPEQATGPDHKVEEIVVEGNDIWAACGKGGLIRSTDAGLSWKNYYLDSANTSATDLRNVIHAVSVAPRTDYSKVLAGSDSGIVVFYFKSPALLDSTLYLPLADDTARGQQVVSISTMVTANGDEIWAATHLLKEGTGFRPATLRSTDGGQTWVSNLIGPPAIVPNEVRIVPQFQDTLVWVATQEGLRQTTNFGQKWNVPLVVSSSAISPTTDTIRSDQPILAVEASPLEFHLGSQSQGAGFLTAYGSSSASVLLWLVLRANLVADSMDFVGYSRVINTFPADTELAGDFVPAMGLQHRAGKTTIWAAVRKTANNQHDGVCITTNRGRTWKLVKDSVFPWNFEFNGDTAWVPTTQGLFMTTDAGTTWDTLRIIDPVSGRSISGNVEIYAAKYVDGVLWVGTNDGVAHSSNLVDWQIVRTFYPIAATAADDDRTYVSPNPFSPYLADGPLKFHYRLKQPGDVTIKIYDFANNLVKTVVGGVNRSADVQYDDIDRWDGRNGKGDIVAGGVYLYIIESSGGDKLSGKFMVIP